MSGEGNPLARHGGLSYLKIPTRDPQASATFYQRVLGWQIDRRAADDLRFTDGSGLLIGAWVRGAASEPGFLPYFYVARVETAIAAAAETGGEVVEAPRLEGDTLLARLRDPAGNLLGIWQFAG